ncbi:MULTISPECIES: globin [Subtercola]|uniref:Globin n=1 Tax=Subtercola vilae TaxID=2056433 RepID=A0A4T2BQD4_9MICO|nr:MULTISPECIES: globin [Subtercola]MEA9986596.1 globin [Subtercola sp. RTI3]TIH31636.1 globin [Subtercola vilae]
MPEDTALPTPPPLGLIPVVPTASVPASSDGVTFYDQLGGRPTFERLVREFYRGVAGDPVLVAMYPEEDLEGAIQRLTGFLEQYWGGPTTYSQQRGHPRLRMRHNPFKVNPDARDRWLTHMRAAVDSLELPPLQDATLWDYLERAAHAMVNTFDE